MKNLINKTIGILGIASFSLSTCNVKNGVYMKDTKNYSVLSQVKTADGEKISKSARDYYVDWDDGTLGTKKDGKVDMVYLQEDTLDKFGNSKTIIHINDDAFGRAWSFFSFTPEYKLKNMEFGHLLNSNQTTYMIERKDNKKAEILQGKFEKLRTRFYHEKE